MCGIAGFFLFNKNNDFPAGGILNAMGDQIAHRGPDDSKVFFDGVFGVSFRRLSIVDIHDGQQPIFNEDRSVVLVVNGEIYNHKALRKDLTQSHKFSSRSDCEVLVHLYEEKGIDFLKDLNGMFAVVLWDIKKQTCYIARDRLGIKPVYYSVSSERLIFGSEIKALFPYPDCPRKFNWFEALDSQKKVYVQDNYCVETYFEDIHQLKGGEYLEIAAGKQLKIVSYWSLFDSIENASRLIDEVEIIAEYNRLLSDSTKMMLLGDVEIGLFLSGGIDSSAIASFAAGQSKLKTFSVFNQDTVESGDAFYANQVANYLNLPNYQVQVTYDPVHHDAAFWKNLVWHCETYECGTEQLFKYELHRFIRGNFPEIKVILLGQGSDEFNGGYSPKYVDESEPLKNNRWNDFEAYLSKNQKQRVFSGSFQGMELYGQFLNSKFVAGFKNNRLSVNPYHTFINAHSKGLQLYQLLHEDRTAMANSIENRVPFLDHRLVELIAAVPPHLHSKLFWDKRILRIGMKDKLAENFCQRKKVPFIFDNKNHYSREIIYQILTANNNELIDYAVGTISQGHEVLDRKEIDKYLLQIKSDKTYKGIDGLRFIVNMGILAKMADETAFRGMSKKNYKDYGFQFYSNETAVKQTSFESALEDITQVLISNRVLTYRLSENIDILTDLRGTWYILLNDEVADIIFENDEHMVRWITVLKHAFHNGRTLTDSIDILGFDEEIFKNQIRHYLDKNLLTVTKINQ